MRILATFNPFCQLDTVFCCCVLLLSIKPTMVNIIGHIPKFDLLQEPRVSVEEGGLFS